MSRVRLILPLILLAGGLLKAQVPRAQQPLETVTGRLTHENHQPALKAGGKTWRLAAENEELRLTLGDERLEGREIRLHGRRKADGTFQAERLFVVRDGKLFKLIYYCYTCSIASHKPGICDCCQKDTVPREVPYESNGWY